MTPQPAHSRKPPPLTSRTSAAGACPSSPEPPVPAARQLHTSTPPQGEALPQAPGSLPAFLGPRLSHLDLWLLLLTDEETAVQRARDLPRATQPGHSWDQRSPDSEPCRCRLPFIIQGLHSAPSRLTRPVLDFLSVWQGQKCCGPAIPQPETATA